MICTRRAEESVAYWGSPGQTWEVGRSAMVEKWRFNSSAIVSGSLMVSEMTSKTIIDCGLDLRPIAVFRTLQVSLMSPRLSSNFWLK